MWEYLRKPTPGLFGIFPNHLYGWILHNATKILHPKLCYKLNMSFFILWRMNYHPDSAWQLSKWVVVLCVGAVTYLVLVVDRSHSWSSYFRG